MSILKSHSGLIFKKLFSKECLDGRGENIQSFHIAQVSLYSLEFKRKRARKEVTFINSMF
jgi:hypothetical protein